MSDVKESHEDNRAVYSGTITNKTDYEVPGVLVSVVYYKDGKIVGGSTERLNSIPAKEKVSFNIQNRSGFNGYDEYEVYAIVES